jgi:polyhydroxyalkanoate synthesis regulator phasin
MQRDAWRTYLELALGLTEASRKKAKKAIKSLVNQSGASVEQVRSMTEELVETSLANREAIAKLVRGELDRALGLVGLASAEEVAELNERIAELERRLRAAESGTAADGTATEPVAEAAPARLPVPRDVEKPVSVLDAARKATAGDTAKSAMTKATAKKTAAKKTAAKKSTAKATGGAAPAKKAVAKKSVAKKAPAKKAATKTAATKTAATKTVAKKAPAAGTDGQSPEAGTTP